MECQVLSPQDMQKIFVNWREIIDCNYMFLRLEIEHLYYHSYMTANWNVLCACSRYRSPYQILVRFGESPDFHTP